jgi:lysophospholipase L1-like esterase
MKITFSNTVIKKVILLIFLSSGLIETILAQEHPAFWEDVQAIKEYDNIYNPPDNPILFIGSSSIRLWDNLERTFAKYVVLNRGIGGSEINHIINYADDIIFPYNPRQIVIYIGENDLVVEGTTADSILTRTKMLFQIIRAKLPDIPIVYLSIKPSPSRTTYLEVAETANALIENYIITQNNITYIDIFHPMLNKEGKPRTELFIEDMLHMNKKGYKIWRKKLKRHLIKK